MNDWARIMVPLSGGEGDKRALAAGAALAGAFEAELACIHAPPDVSDLIPWMGDGFMGGVQATAIQSLRDAAAVGEKSARAAMDAAAYPRSSFMALVSPVWTALAMEARLSDVVLFEDQASRGKGPLSESFQQLVADEQRPTLVARPGFKVGGVMAIAWDGGKEASRAARTAIPLLRKASAVTILSAPKATSRVSDAAKLQAFLASRGVAAGVQTLACTGDAGTALVQAAKAAGADILVAGAFGHTRLQEFVFGGATRSFLQSEGLSLFLSH